MPIFSLKNRKDQDAALKKQMADLLPRLRRFARSLARDPEIADDLVQATCERALERLNQVKDDRRVNSWLFRILYTRWIDHLRRRKTRSDYLAVWSKDNEVTGGPDNAVGKLEESIDIYRAMATLPPQNRAAVSLVCIEGYSYMEAGEILEIPQGTVASRVARARISLGRLLLHKEKPAAAIRSIKKNERRK